MIEWIRAFLLSVLNDASKSHIQMAFIVTIRHSKISACCQQSPRYLERPDGGREMVEHDDSRAGTGRLESQ